MLGVDDAATSLGVIPCAIDWLFRLIGAQKQRTGARFSVRVSAVEITGKDELLRDLLADTATGQRHCSLLVAAAVLQSRDEQTSVSCRRWTRATRHFTRIVISRRSV